MGPSADRRYLSDPRRVNEFRKHYQSKHTLHRRSVIAGSRSLPSDPDRPDTLAAAVTETDFTLGAYATCVVHSIDADKVMVSLLDDTTQYFLGGATKHTSTVVEGDENPELWFGCNSIGIAGGICEVACSATPDGVEYPFYVIPDIADEPQWRDVVGKYRFYAGIPITTRTGYNIGTLFAFSTRPRPQLEPREKLVMERMAREIMNHLELELHVLERNRLLRMNQSLAQFTAGRDAVKLRKGSTSSMKLSQRTRLSREERGGGVGRCEEAEDRPQKTTAGVSPCEETASSTRLRQDEIERTPAPVNTNDTIKASLLFPSLGSPATDSGFEAAKQISKGPPHSSTYKRAASMLRDGMECSGVVFLSFDRDNSHEAYATLLGEDTQASTKTISPPHAFPAHVLRELLRLHVQGQIFYFDSEGKSWPTADNNPSASVFCQPHLIAYPDSDTESERGGEQESYGQNLARTLHKSVPSAKQILVVPLQSTREDVVGVSVAWNNNWDRIMTHSVELPFTVGFCANIFVEISHQEAIVANRQKADFIANVSHELRSPLHGILATSELLKETACSQLQHSLVEDVQSCGRVLLNTIDHVLDFSNLIRSEKKTPRAMRERNDSTVTLHGRTLVPEHQSNNSLRNPLLLNQPTSLDLAVLFEDVTDSVFISRFFHGGVSSTAARAVSSGQSDSTTWSPPVVSINIASSDWNFVVQPGAMQRIVMNLLGNAIKYTTSGFIQVDLAVDGPIDTQATDDRDSHSIVSLIVRDSGRGLSPDYIRTRLWCAFAQEDQTVRGTGLGLSITRKIVNLMGGTIDLQSTVNVGTTVTVKLPLRRVSSSEEDGVVTTANPNRPSQGEPLDDGAGQPSDMSRLGKGRTVVVCLRNALSDGPCVSQQKPEAKYANAALVRYLREWFSFTVIEQLETGLPADLIIMDEERMTDTQFPSDTPRLILKDSSYIDINDQQTANMAFTCLRRPVAPRKLERALREALGREKRSDVVQNAFQGELAAQGEHQLGTDPTASIGADAVPSSSSAHDITAPILENRTFSLDGLSTKLNRLVVRAGTDPKVQADVTPDRLESTPTLPDAPGASSASQTQMNQPRVLVVDDNPINVKVLCAFLYRKPISKAHVAIAVNGLDAVQQFSQARTSGRPFDIVLMDLNMPVKDGFEAMADIREYETSRGMPPTTIVALTGLVSERDQERAFTAGANQFFSKPFSSTQVQGIVDAWQRGIASRAT